VAAMVMDTGALTGLVILPVLSENHIRTYWWCSPARIGMATMAPDRWTARCKGASFCKVRACLIVIRRISGKNLPQVHLAEDYHLIQAHAAQCADQTFSTATATQERSVDRGYPSPSPET
jgi:hypothetical protein